MPKPINQEIKDKKKKNKKALIFILQWCLAIIVLVFIIIASPPIIKSAKFALVLIGVWYAVYVTIIVLPFCYRERIKRLKEKLINKSLALGMGLDVIIKIIIFACNACLIIYTWVASLFSSHNSPYKLHSVVYNYGNVLMVLAIALFLFTSCLSIVENLKYYNNIKKTNPTMLRGL